MNLLLTSLIAYARTALPPQLYDILATILINGYALYLFLSSKLPLLASINMNTDSILPLLFSGIALYFTLRTWYHSTLYAFRVGWFLLKWGTVLGGVLYVFVLGGGGNTELGRALGLGQERQEWNVDDWGNWMSSLLTQTPPRERHGRRQGNPPGIFDSFDQHRTYASRQQQRWDAPPAPRDESPIDSVLDQIKDTWRENGKHWWEMLGKAAGFVDDEDDQDEGGTNQNQRDGRRRSERIRKKKATASAKGKGRTR